MTDVLGQGLAAIIPLVFMLGLVVVVHELGHYLAGRYFGAAAESFAVGFGAPIFEVKDKRNTRWRINWIPLGGFVKFVGEAQAPGDVGRIEEGPIGKPYMDLSVGARSIVALAGPLANFVLAIFLFTLVFWVNGTQSTRIGIVEVAEPQAIEAGLQPGDIFETIDGMTIQNNGDIQRALLMKAGEDVALIVQRGEDQIALTIIPEEVVRENAVGQLVPQATLGVGIMALTDQTRWIDYTLPQAAMRGVEETGDILGLTVKMISKMVTGQEPLSHLTGPVGMGDVGRRLFNMTIGNEQVSFWQGVSAFFWNLVAVSAAISIGIGFFNLLPLPVLDGGHLVFNAYEAITGKVMPEQVQEYALKVGICLLLTLVILITWGDIIETGLLSQRTG